MKTKILAAILSASCCAAAHAADTYTIDPNHTGATFSFKHLGFSTFHSKLPASGGTIVLDRAQKSGSVDVTFEIDDIATGVDKFDDHLESADFFDAEKFPTATFKSSKVTFTGDAPSSITGELTIKGQTKPVTLQVTSFKCGEHPMTKAAACGADATAKIKRSDFGVDKYVPAVSDEIDLMIEVEASKK